MADWELDPGKVYANEQIRADLLRRCSSPHTRSVTPSRERPCRWQPGTVRNSKSNAPYRADEAWTFVVEVLRSGIPIEVITLDLPLGKTGYVIKPVGHGGEVLYLKFEFGASGVFGRSFHVSEYQPKS